MIIYDDGIIQLTGAHDIERDYEESPIGGTSDSIEWAGEYINVHCYRARGFIYSPETGVTVSGTLDYDFAVEIDDEGFFRGGNDKDDAALTEAILAKIGPFNYAEFDMPTIQLSAGVI